MGANHCLTLQGLFFPHYLPHFCASCHRLAIQALTASLASASQVLSPINASWAAVRHLLFNPITVSGLWEQVMWTWGHLKHFRTCLNTGTYRGQDRETCTSPTPFSVTANLNVRSLHCRQQGPLFPCTPTDVTVSHGWARPAGPQYYCLVWVTLTSHPHTKTKALGRRAKLASAPALGPH